MPSIELFREKETDNQILNWNYKFFNSNLLEKYRFVWCHFQKQDLFTKYKLNLEKFPQFLYKVKSLYEQYNNPYHNFDHALNGNPIIVSSI